PCAPLFPYTTLFRSRPAVGGSGVEVYPLPIDDEVVSAGGGVEEGAGRRRLGRQCQVKRPLIHDIGNRLLRYIGELSPIPRDHLRSEEHTSELQSRFD